MYMKSFKWKIRKLQVSHIQIPRCLYTSIIIGTMTYKWKSFPADIYKIILKHFKSSNREQPKKSNGIGWEY